ncbi:Hypothetical Protein FCC1311_078702 [Hondaea fermentalgiana]|uniref:Uncharacterized protein n=1 Tax=Hondaea fermentalgiana TaxID=2315210 RepID=A0A2R5GLZ6_9STRA|nr:Hypothetical Protein FCC1311_078702 [Hondaea fermentalgiana]|eukprot:GBG31645.1 Hypothetical Protein FCC1311_078702 [Hondaea fermentalgiana]
MAMTSHQQGSAELLRRVETLLSGKLSSSGEAIIDVFRPLDVKIDEVVQRMQGCLGCLGGGGKKAQATRLRMQHEIYVVTSQAVYTLLDKPALTQVAAPLGIDVESFAPYTRIHYDQMQALERPTTRPRCVEIVGMQSWLSPQDGSGTGKVTLRWYPSDGTDSAARILINKTYEEHIGAIALSTLPKGALENRITSN